MKTNQELKVQVFNRAFEAAKEIAFNPSWSNGTGYFNNLCNPLANKEYPEGDLFKTVDEHGRKMVIIGTYFGPVVVFERYGNGNKEGIYTYNAPHSFDATDIISTKGAIDLQAMQELLGHHDHYEFLNIGQKLKKVSEMAEKVAALRIKAALNKSKQNQAA